MARLPVPGRRHRDQHPVETGTTWVLLSDEELASYHARAAQLAPPDMLAWLHSPLNRN
jgi:hypothetical protein